MTVLILNKWRKLSCILICSFHVSKSIFLVYSLIFLDKVTTSRLVLLAANIPYHRSLDMREQCRQIEEPKSLFFSQRAWRSKILPCNFFRCGRIIFFFSFFKIYWLLMLLYWLLMLLYWLHCTIGFDDKSKFDTNF